MVAMTLLGYLALGRFIAQQLVLTGTVCVAGSLVYLTIRSVTRTMEQPANPIGNALAARLRFEPARVNEFAWLVEVLLAIALMLVAVPLVLVQWGFTAADIRDWFTAPSSVSRWNSSGSRRRASIGIILFVALLFATRIFHAGCASVSWAAPARHRHFNRSSPPSAMPVSRCRRCSRSYAGLITSHRRRRAVARHRLRPAVDRQQLRLRPHPAGRTAGQVGDRIVAGDQEGHVRRISVRSTEIETFDRAVSSSNSELITGRAQQDASQPAGSHHRRASYDADPSR